MKTKFYPLKVFILVVCTSIGLVNPETSTAQLCANPNTLFGIDNSGNIYSVNSSNAATSAVINTANYGSALSYTTVVAGQTSGPASPNGMGYNSVNGKFYYFKRDPGGGGKQFVSYDPAINMYTTLALTPVSFSVHSACVNFNGTGYYCLDVKSNLYYYDIALDTWTFITATFTDQFANNVSATFTSMNTGDMAIDGFNNLWILPSKNNILGLYKMAAPLPTTAVASVTLQEMIPPTNPTPSNKAIYGVAFDASGNFYMSTSAGDVYKLTAPAAAPVLIGTMAQNMTDLTSCAFPLTVLPVTWTSFTASLQNNGTVLLNWATTAQTGSNGFFVERSTDGTSWKQAGFVQSGMLNNPSYSFSDPNAVDGKNFYRLKIVTNDGSFLYSKTVGLTIKNTEKISLWPNPVTSRLNIHVGTENTNSAYAITLDAGGRAVIKNNLQAGINTLNLQSLPAGAYTVQVHLQNGEIHNEKIVKQ